MPFMGGASLLFTVQFFFLKYATDVLLLSPMVIGLVFGLSRLVDAVTDPLVGTWSDRTTSRMGRRAPWMLLATPLIAISFFLIWNPPAMKELATTVWVGGWLVVFYVCFTGYNVPHFALGAEISESPHSKTRLYGSRQIVETIGMLLAFVVIQTISDDTDPRTRTMGVMALLCIVSLVLMLGTPLLQAERQDYRDRGGARLRISIRDVFRNRYAMRLFIAWWFAFCGMSAMGVMSPYIAEHVLGRPDLIATLPGVFVVASVLAIPIWVRLARYFGKIRVWIWSMVGTGVALGSLLFNQTLHLGWFFTATALMGCGLACASIMGPSMLADVIDFDEQMTRERKEGLYASIFGLISKSGAAFVAVVIGFVLSVNGYAPTEAPTESMKAVLLNTFVGFPVVGTLACALILRNFDLARSSSPFSQNDATGPPDRSRSCRGPHSRAGPGPWRRVG